MTQTRTSYFFSEVDLRLFSIWGFVLSIQFLFSMLDLVFFLPILDFGLFFYYDQINILVGTSRTNYFEHPSHVKNILLWLPMLPIKIHYVIAFGLIMILYISKFVTHFCNHIRNSFSQLTHALTSYFCIYNYKTAL